jgi:diguanylate cyclase (GGDEF)-like protein
MRQRLTQLAAHLPAHGNLPEMGRELVTQLRRIFGLESATLLVADPETRILMTLATSSEDPQRRLEQSYLLEPDDPGVVMLGRAGRPLRADQVAPHSATLRQRLEAFRVETAQALLSGSSLVGLILLGPKSDGERLVSEELELLTLFSHMVATVLENAHLFQSATYESLTGLLRREAVLAALELEFERAVRYGRPLAVGMADIDRFKRVNDSHGHLAGDAVLKLVGQTLKAGLRASDTIGRYGGEEFLFFLPETDLSRSVQVAEKLRTMVAALRTPVAGGVELSVTVSIGVASLDPGVHGTATDLVAAADESLYQAKHQGRNRVVPTVGEEPATS